MEIGKMRRRTREITEKKEIEAILERESICHLAMCTEEQPYVIPMLYAYKDNCFYFHCAEVGAKLDILEQNNSVCIEVESNKAEALVENTNTPCMWGLPYESVVVFGKATVSDDRDVKLKAFDLLVEKIHTPGYEHSRDKYLEKRLNGARVIVVEVEKMTGKKWDGVK